MTVFIKRATAESLRCESEGLQRLQHCIEQANISQLNTPEIIELNTSYMTLAQIDSVSPSAAQMAELGIGLAKLHNQPQKEFGYAVNNFIGLSPQNNIFTDNWGEFFLNFRLQPQVHWIKNSEVKHQFRAILSGAQTKLVERLNSSCQTPSLLHGDLWSGNVMFSTSQIYLIDPAVYFGDSEADIAMTEMFGGFHPEFYQAYQSLRPLSRDYAFKREIYNLYHYLNHYNLFGSAYLPACESAMATLRKI